MAEFNEALHPRVPKGKENGGQFTHLSERDITDEKLKYYDETIKYLEDETGVKFTKSKSSNSYYGEKNGLKIRISDHASKFAEKQYNIFHDSAIDLPFIGITRLAMTRAINQTDPFINYKKGDTIKHKAQSIGIVTYLDSNYKKEWVLVKNKDGREVKYFMEVFYNDIIK